MDPENSISKGKAFEGVKCQHIQQFYSMFSFYLKVKGCEMFINVTNLHCKLQIRR